MREAQVLLRESSLLPPGRLGGFEATTRRTWFPASRTQNSPSRSRGRRSWASRPPQRRQRAGPRGQGRGRRLPGRSCPPWPRGVAVPPLDVLRGPARGPGGRAQTEGLGAPERHPGTPSPGARGHPRQGQRGARGGVGGLPPTPFSFDTGGALGSAQGPQSEQGREAGP